MMIRFLYRDQLSDYPVLSDTMFKDRADQFKRRLEWKVHVDERGCEVDQYDHLNPLYVVREDDRGRHGGSMRFLPTVGRTMVNEHFTHLTDGVSIQSPLIWECTRFCIAPGAGAGVTAALMLAACEMGLRFGLEQSVAVFDVRMPRIYARLGWSPDVIGSSGTGRDEICIGLWTFSEEVRAELSRRSSIPLNLVGRWFDASFDRAPMEETRVA
jgi:acyl homoserine lactone synthase